MAFVSRVCYTMIYGKELIFMDRTQNLFTTTGLKMIAVISMLIDHFGAAFFVIYTSYYDKTQDFAGADIIYQVLRAVGRTAFPIFCFVLVEGFYHTRNRYRYLARLLVFSVLSEIPFDLALQDGLFERKMQNVFFTLLIGCIAMFLIEKVRDSNRGDPIFRISLGMVIGMAGMLLAYFLKTDYSAFGVLLLLIFYWFRSDRRKACVCGYLCMIWEYLCFPAFLLIYHYNGQKGKNLKYFFYLFYPLHLLALYGLRLLALR